MVGQDGRHCVSPQGVVPSGHLGFVHAQSGHVAHSHVLRFPEYPEDERRFASEYDPDNDDDDDDDGSVAGRIGS